MTSVDDGGVGAAIVSAAGLISLRKIEGRAGKALLESVVTPGKVTRAASGRFESAESVKLTRV